MKRALIPLAAALASILGAIPAFADPQSSSADPDVAGPRCVRVVQIDHTQVLDNKTILFHLTGGRVLRNTLIDDCFGLRLSTRGFTYLALNDEVCGNLQSIRVNDTGTICQLGPFVEEPKKP